MKTLEGIVGSTRKFVTAAFLVGALATAALYGCGKKTEEIRAPRPVQAEVALQGENFPYALKSSMDEEAKKHIENAQLVIVISPEVITKYHSKNRILLEIPKWSFVYVGSNKELTLTADENNSITNKIKEATGPYPSALDKWLVSADEANRIANEAGFSPSDGLFFLKTEKEDDQSFPVWVVPYGAVGINALDGRIIRPELLNEPEIKTVGSGTLCDGKLAITAKNLSLELGYSTFHAEWYLQYEFKNVSGKTLTIKSLTRITEDLSNGERMTAEERPVGGDFLYSISKDGLHEERCFLGSFPPILEVDKVKLNIFYSDGSSTLFTDYLTKVK